MISFWVGHLKNVTLAFSGSLTYTGTSCCALLALLTSYPVAWALMRQKVDAAKMIERRILQMMRRSVARSQAVLSCLTVAILRLAMYGVAAVACRWT